jgi:hypothetical protein
MANSRDNARTKTQRIKEIVDDLCLASAELCPVWPMQQFLVPAPSKSSDPSPKRRAALI